MNAALNVGCDPRKLTEVFFQLATYGGMPKVNEALKVYREVLKERGEWPMRKHGRPTDPDVRKRDADINRKIKPDAVPDKILSPPACRSKGPALYRLVRVLGMRHSLSERNICSFSQFICFSPWPASFSTTTTRPHAASAICLARGSLSSAVNQTNFVPQADISVIRLGPAERTPQFRGAISFFSASSGVPLPAKLPCWYISRGQTAAQDLRVLMVSHKA